MSINIGPPEVDELKPKIAVIGVGGAGGNAIANMIAAQVEGVDFVVANTDAQALKGSPAELRIQLGADITEGLGAGSRPEVGRAAAEESIVDVEQVLEGTHMCFIAAGMGGGTGTGAAPVIAKAARDKGILTVGVVTKPFTFEGSRRMKSADAGIEELQKNVDTLIVIPNQNLFLVANPNTTFKEAFLLADEVLQQGVRGITDLMVMPGLINLDFADVRSVMHEMGKAMMGTGEAEGDHRALEAAEKAIANPLLDGVSLNGAKGVIVSITGGEDMRLMEVDEAANHIRELVDPDANIIWGSAFNEDLDGRIRVSVVATGIDADASHAPPPAARSSFAMSDYSPSSQGTTSDDSRSDEDESSSDEPTAETNAPAFSSAVPPQPDVVSEPVAAPKPAFSQSSDPFDEENSEATAEEEVDPVSEISDAGPSLAQHGEARPSATIQDDSVAEDEGSAAPSFAALRDSVRSGGDAVAGNDDDELVLGSEDITPIGSDEAKPAPRVASGGGTLFERMSNLTRGSGAAEKDEKDEKSRDPLEIPRFLNRQNNQ